MSKSDHKAKYWQFDLPDNLTEAERRIELRKRIAKLVNKPMVTDQEVSHWLNNYDKLKQTGLI